MARISHSLGFKLLIILSFVLSFAAQADDSEGAIILDIKPIPGLAKLEVFEADSCTLFVPNLNTHTARLIHALKAKGYSPVVDNIFETDTDTTLSVEKTAISLKKNIHSLKTYRGYLYLSANLTIGLIAARSKLVLNTVGDIDNRIAESVKRTFSFNLGKEIIFSADDLPQCVVKSNIN